MPDAVFASAPDLSKFADALRRLWPQGDSKIPRPIEGTITAAPALFAKYGVTSPMAPANNAWSVLDDIYQTPNPPQWNAIVAFNH